MENKTRNSALAFAGLKFGQQISHDLESVVADNTQPDYMLYGTEQICRIGAAGAAAYTADKIIEHVETLALPKYLRGLFPLAISTLGVGVAINYSGNWFGITENVGLIPTTIQLLRNYQESIAKLITFNPDTHAGYLAGAFLAIKSGVRFGKNLAEKIIEASERKQRYGEKRDRRNERE